jgi:hypothetical protein
MNTAPLLPELELPELRTIAPLLPLTPEFEVTSNKLPLEVELL